MVGQWQSETLLISGMQSIHPSFHMESFFEMAGALSQTIQAVSSLMHVASRFQWTSETIHWWFMVMGVLLKTNRLSEWFMLMCHAVGRSCNLARGSLVTAWWSMCQPKSMWTWPVMFWSMNGHTVQQLHGVSMMVGAFCNFVRRFLILKNVVNPLDNHTRTCWPLLPRMFVQSIKLGMVLNEHLDNKFKEVRNQVHLQQFHIQQMLSVQVKFQWRSMQLEVFSLVLQLQGSQWLHRRPLRFWGILVSISRFLSQAPRVNCGTESLHTLTNWRFLKKLRSCRAVCKSLQETLCQFRQQRNQMMRMKSNDINLPTHLMQLGVNLACKGKDVLKDMRQIQVDFKIESFQVCHLILHTLASLVNQWMLIQQLQNWQHWFSWFSFRRCALCPGFCKESEEIHGDGSCEILAVLGSLRHLLEMWPRACNSGSAELTSTYMAKSETSCSDWEFQTLGSCKQLLGWESSGQCQKHEFSVVAWTFQASELWDSSWTSIVFMGLHTCVLDQKQIWSSSRGDILWAHTRACLSRTFVPVCRASHVLCWGYQSTQGWPKMETWHFLDKERYQWHVTGSMWRQLEVDKVSESNFQRLVWAHGALSQFAHVSLADWGCAW